MSSLNRSQFKFKRHDRIGSEGAEQDTEFLRDCFVDTGDLGVLRDTKDPRRIVVGRTGAGKTALLLLLQTNEAKTAAIDPDQLALSYISNSTIVKQLTDLGVNLDLFYRLLWRHVFAVELIQLRYQLRTEKDQESFLSRITKQLFGDKRKQEALDYLLQWGSRFWKDTEMRIQEVTETFERDVKAGLGVKAATLELMANDAEKVSVSERTEIVHKAQEIVNSLQMQKLTKVIEILASEVFGDPQQRYFIIIDRLDENWVPDPLRYRLIRALIETVKDFQRIRTAKVVVALRRDLLQRVFRETRDAGFQEEKYQALYLSITWTKEQLLSVLDERLNRLVKSTYSGRRVTWKDVFPESINRVETGDYLVERTLYRPRDIIQFCNCCIELATDRPSITAQMVRDAEAQYSQLRFRSLGDEWAADYPELLDVSDLLKRRPQLFPISDLSESDLEKLCLSEIERDPPGRLSQLFQSYIDEKIKLDELRERLVDTFYIVGLVGIKPEANKPVSWSFRERDTLGTAEISSAARIAVTPMFYRVLATSAEGTSAPSS
jgi:hypothetical protein